MTTEPTDAELKAMTDTNTLAPTDAEILALNAGEVHFSESPSKYPAAGFGTQYHAGSPGVLSFARAVLAAKWGTHALASQPVAAPSGPLTDSQIADIYFEALGSQHLREQDRKMVMRFARAIEAELRKQDEALIRQMLEALDGAIAITMGKIDLRNAVIAAARERLESKP